ncbi:MAG: PilZ domain-containing protein [Thermodesulfobacteriota bacterium]
MVQSERRKNNRLKVKKGITGLLTPDIPQVGKIIDISVDGLSFVCRECDLPVNSPVDMDILIMDKDLFFPNVSGIIVAKSVVYDEVINCGPMPMKRCGVKFKPLKANQRLKLNSLIFPDKHLDASW